MGLPSGKGLYWNSFCHVLSIILTFSSFVVLLITVFYNAPLDHEHQTLEGKMNNRFWLIVVNETSNTLVFDDHKRSDIMKNITQTEIVNRQDDIDTNLTTSILINRDQFEKRGGSGIYAYGFGVWGWCGWSDNKWTSNAICTKKPFWQLPKDSKYSRDNIDQILKDLPTAIKNALSITSFFLLFTPFLVFVYLILLLFCINFKGPYPPWPVPRKSQWPKEEVKQEKKVKIAWNLRNWRVQLYFFALSVIFMLPAIVTIGVGVNSVKSEMDIGGGLKAEMGHGGLGVIAAWLLFILAQCLTMSKYGLMAWRKDIKNKTTK
ncbi:uncharacterized protein I206_101014 [Kwoniella pini CBS 10737]|uniref:Uncharacterized protein n=1 Tax=Kwoniella pini CBS 10737 TaxID=1296096 RepID=A0A1B9IC93_9TREE|nr:uncharacterized protein I206_00312 [Kwoniella pini CBS 10737]OCF53011.1 hypothetical protein I206_00312 [Kwoniella pini CBS 10737]